MNNNIFSNKQLRNISIIWILGLNFLRIIKIVKCYLGFNKYKMEERADPTDLLWEDHMWKVVFEKRSKYAIKYSYDKFCLDLCCGTGWTTYKVSKVADKVIGIDYSKDAIKIAKSKYQNSNIIYKVMNALDLKFDNERFDVVICMEAIEHFSKKEGLNLINEAYRVLKRGGVFIGSTPAVNYRNPLHIWLLKLKDPYHLFLYSEKLLKKSLNFKFSNVKIELQKEGWFLFTCKK
ncbi:MAG: class I SAM-dependent methyltransferase [Candidatus Cloacimonetes bacterium]|nr:class I SAM-dependent methyltransferase [Candidatus Cloacimonadota bacterium]